MAVINTFKKDIESKIIKEGFRRWDNSKWGTYLKIGTSYVDWISSPIFSERDGKVGISVSRAFFNIESILQFIIPGRIIKYYTFHDVESWENTDAQFSYDAIGAKQASEYLTYKIFEDSLIKFGEFRTPEVAYNEYLISSNPILQVGLEPKRGKFAVYRDLLMSKLYAPDLYDQKFVEATNHFNQILKDYSETLRNRNQELTIDPINTNTSKLGRLDLFLELRRLETFHEVTKQLTDDFVRNLER